MDRPDVHIASCVAYVRPESADQVWRAIAATGVAEVPLRDNPRGRLVLLIERGSAGEVLDVIEAVRALDGVLAVHLVYQHCESQSEMQEPHT